MLEQHAIVLRTEGGKAWVEARESGTCGSCGSGGCSTRRLADLFGRRERAFPVDNVLQAKTGERVVIGIPPGALWQSALRLYGLPLLLLFAGGLLGQQLQGDAGAFAGAVVGLLLAVPVQKFLGFSRAFRPVMLRRDNQACAVAKSC